MKFLSECLNIYFARKVIILIDEYDVPLESAHLNGYYEEMVDFIRSLFESALKTNPHLEFAVLTECLPLNWGKFALQTFEVSQSETLFTGMNNLKIISILNQKYDEYFGFTDAEVEKICADYGLSGRLGTIRDWYNGYIFRTKVLGWFDEQVKSRDQRRLFQAFLECDTGVVREEIEDMLMQTISFYDAYESFYHGFLAGILYGIDGYVVKSNREGGSGRTDLFISCRSVPQSCSRKPQFHSTFANGISLYQSDG